MLMRRQLLPFDAPPASKGSVRTLRTLYRWIAWDDDPITAAMAEIHLRVQRGVPVVVRCRRGPQGGWTGATFLRRHDPPPKDVPAQRLPPGTKTPLTMYCGWVLVPILQNAAPPMPNVDWGQHRAHLILHA